MSRFLLALLLASAPLLAQAPAPSSHRKASTPDRDDNKWLAQVSPLEQRARQILKAELSRKLHPGCDYSQLYKRLSNAGYTRYAEADKVVTEHNYQAFVDALSASLSILPPDEDPEIFPLPSKNFETAEAAWRTYLDRTCAALGDTYGAGTGAGPQWHNASNTSHASI
jgi:hypothetical protein